MSFFNVEQAKARLNRSELAVPGSQPQMFEKAAKSAADVVFLDLEDAVAPDDKAQARKNIIQVIQSEADEIASIAERMIDPISAIRRTPARSIETGWPSTVWPSTNRGIVTPACAMRKLP